DPSVQWLVGRNASVAGVYLGRLMKLRPDIVRDAAAELLAMWERGEIDPIVGATFPLAEAEDAHGLIEAPGHVGKVVLRPGWRSSPAARAGSAARSGRGSRPRGIRWPHSI